MALAIGRYSDAPVAVARAEVVMGLPAWRSASLPRASGTDGSRASIFHRAAPPAARLRRITPLISFIAYSASSSDAASKARTARSNGLVVHRETRVGWVGRCYDLSGAGL